LLIYHRLCTRAETLVKDFYWLEECGTAVEVRMVSEDGTNHLMRTGMQALTPRE